MFRLSNFLAVSASLRILFRYCVRHANPSYVGLETAAVFAYLSAAVHLWLKLDRISNELRADATGSECFGVARLNYINDFSCECMDS